MEKETLGKSVSHTIAHLQSTSKLTTGLGDEQECWTKNVTAFELEIRDLFVAAAYVAYFGSFMSLHCLELVLSWIQCFVQYMH